MTVQSFTETRKCYEVTETSCTCGDWTYRGSRTGKPCKQMLAIEVARYIGILQSDTPCERQAYCPPDRVTARVVPPMQEFGAHPNDGLRDQVLGHCC